MADITDERLREIATSDPLVLAISAQMGEASWADVRAIAAELLTARARIKSLEGCIVRNMEAAIRRIPKAGAARFDPVMAALARASQERDAARADLSEARELLAQVDDGQVPHDTWLDARNALLAKHKETP